MLTRKAQDASCKAQAGKAQDASCKAQDASCKAQAGKAQDASCKAQDASCKAQDASCKAQDASCKAQKIKMLPIGRNTDYIVKSDRKSTDFTGRKKGKNFFSKM